MSRFTVSIVALLAACSTPLLANSLIGPGPRASIAKSRISASPASEWNKLSLSEGKNVEVWTLDGESLNKVTFFGGIAAGQPLLRERDKKNSPLPKVDSNMLVTDIPTLLETTYRSQYAVNQMAIDSQAPAKLDGHAGIRFTYSFTKSDDVRRKGEAFGAMLNGQLYLITYEAPEIYFFDKDVEKFRTLATSIKL